MSGAPHIRALTADDIAVRLDEFCDLLLDIVGGGASIGFMAPLSAERARRFWQGIIASVERGEDAAQSVFLLLINLVNLAGFLSVGLGLVNLLPIPILDGGHLVYYAYEAVARRPLSMRAQAIGFRVGLALVLGMMLVATWNDLNYLLGQIF